MKLIIILLIFFPCFLCADNSIKSEDNLNSPIDIDSENISDNNDAELSEESEKVQKYLEKMEKRITLRLTTNPKNQPLTLTYVVFKISKRVDVPFLRDKTREMVEDIEDIRLSRINAKQTIASSLLKSVVAARGLEIIFTDEGFFLQKKERTVLTEEEREALKEKLRLEEKKEVLAEEEKAEEHKCSKCGDVITLYLEKKREHCTSCWEKKNKKKKKVIIPRSSY